MNRIMLWVVSAAVVVLGLILVAPSVSAWERNRLALSARQLVENLDWTASDQVCTPVRPVSPGELTCKGNGECYLKSVAALREGEWQNAHTSATIDSDALVHFVLGWKEKCRGEDAQALQIWRRAENPIGEKFLSDGEYALVQKDLSKAIHNGNLAQQLIPSARTHLLLARSQAQLGNYHQALQEYRAVLTFDNTNAEIYWLVSDLEWRLEERAAARTHLERAIDLNPNEWLYWHRYGQILSSAGEPGRAESAFMRAVQLNPTYGFAYAGVALARLDQNKLSEALEPTLQAVNYLDDPKFKAGYLGMYASALARAGKYASAASFFEQAVAYDPVHEGFWAGLLEAYRKQGDCDALSRAYHAYEATMHQHNKTVVAPRVCP